MLAPLNRLLENISVRAKLTLGFGVVMLLTLLIATTGWLGIRALGDRSDRILDIAKLNDLTRDVRNARLFYSINPNAERAAAVVKLLDSLDSHLANDRSVFHSPASRPLLENASTVAKSYRAHFNDFSQAVQARDATRAVFGGHADEAVAQLKKLMEMATSPSGDQAQIDSLVKAQTVVQQARFQLRGYSYSLKPELQKPAKEAIDDAIAYIKTLFSHLPAAMTADVQRLQQAMSSYRDTVALFSDAQDKADSAQVQLDGDIKNLLAATQQLSQDQIDQRRDDVEAARNLLAGALLAALLLGIIAAWVITRLIVGPLMETLRRAEQVASGNLSDNATVSRRDELGLLQLSMQRMTLNLRELIGGLRDGVIRISGAAEQLSAVTEQTRKGVNNQRHETDQVATAMNEMAATVQEVARNAEQASSAAVNASHEARAGDEVLAQAMTQIERLADEVGNSTLAMSDLKQESERIGSVLDVIKSVAQQTNLLALNAAIEAARAGEAGRGFAVVADEVRSLAQRTQSSTEEIEQLISGLQGGTDKVASSLDSSRALTDSSVELTRRAGASLHGISESVQAIESMNHQIATAAEQQSAVAEEINRSVINVRDISEQTSTASEETAASSVELTRLGNHLQTLVGKFTL
ncbi:MULTISPECIES: HAMP domain-containing methyl-accepting chemotaxis protein [Pseudomonas]|uniref:Methyl-accepting chemotaxis protein n=1 Tax=Pseudomonas asplenii TaxID=53407 RepID=A0A0M9GHP0_9PSED|nr:methyl-accepting chemotaxis protein [Pseudomonas fuscovaginae]KPA91243.1 methyl-accepting chemotaxis protein [Pseudomonas fuscovaginae]KPA94016.1 methyl-accepting chemotaxis protein [Pseudomonas fuscovaginae]